jgi:hypothetical protein
MQCTVTQKTVSARSGLPANCSSSIYNSLSASGLQDE